MRFLDKPTESREQPSGVRSSLLRIDHGASFNPLDSSRTPQPMLAAM